MKRIISPSLLIGKLKRKNGEEIKVENHSFITMKYCFNNPMSLSDIIGKSPYVLHTGLRNQLPVAPQEWLANTLKKWKTSSLS